MFDALVVAVLFTFAMLVGAGWALCRAAGRGDLWRLDDDGPPEIRSVYRKGRS